MFYFPNLNDYVKIYIYILFNLHNFLYSDNVIVKMLMKYYFKITPQKF